ncbi:MAG: OmpA family protein [Proteobacteria bacterium]|nr:OmpA family protein [Pseudomonadota bacterium]
MAKIILTAVFTLITVSFMCACSSSRKRDPVDLEETRRASLEMQSLMDMASSRAIPPVDFETGSAVLAPSSYAMLDRVAELLLRHPLLKLIVEGHTDDVGGDERNETLSLERAGSVKQYLASKGIHPDSIRIYGFGAKRPVSEDLSDRGRALNRRVEFKITTRDWESVF